MYTVSRSHSRTSTTTVRLDYHYFLHAIQTKLEVCNETYLFQLLCKGVQGQNFDRRAVADSIAANVLEDLISIEKSFHLRVAYAEYEGDSIKID